MTTSVSSSELRLWLEVTMLLKSMLGINLNEKGLSLRMPNLNIKEGGVKMVGNEGSGNC